MPTRLLGEQRDEIEGRIASASILMLYVDLDAMAGPAVHACPSPGPELEPEMRSALEEISRLEGLLVCVMSGRPVAELRRQVDIAAVVHSGDHGLEVDSEAFRFVHPEAARCRMELAELGARLSGLPLLVPGVVVQPRPLAVSVGFQPGDEEAQQRLRAMVRSLIQSEGLDLRVTERKTSFEIYPGLDWNEGAAMKWVHQRINTSDALTLVIAGHSTDESVFRAIDAAITVRVGPGTATEDGYTVDGPEQVPPLLDWLRDLWTRRMNRADPALHSEDVRPVLTLRRASPILNVRLRREAIGRRRHASG